jgi:hypothetical protein
MTASNSPRAPLQCPDTAELERMLSAVEHHLQALGEAMRRHDSGHIEHHASTLREALARAISGFNRASRAGRVPVALRARLVSTHRQIAMQREAVLRASVALDSALAVLLPRARSVVYDHPVRTVPPTFSH